jgi:hypothetical protein
MNGNDLARRMGPMRANTRLLSKVSRLWRRGTELPEVTGEECARQAKDPARRLEPLMRRSEDELTPAFGTRPLQ